MRATLLVARREVAAYLNSYYGYIIVAVVLCLQGLWFNAWVLGDSPKASAEVLQEFINISFGFTITASVFISMRLVAEERQTGTIVLLDASPLSDWQLVVGKYLSAMTILLALLLMSVYMPGLIFVNGKVSLAHIGTGYLGVLLAASATTAIGTFCSSLARSQLLAGVMTAVSVVTLLLAWLLGRVTDAPLDQLWSYASLYDRHFQPFMKGRINTEDIVFYLSVTLLFLLLAARRMSARRWQ